VNIDRKPGDEIFGGLVEETEDPSDIAFRHVAHQDADGRDPAHPRAAVVTPMPALAKELVQSAAESETGSCLCLCLRVKAHVRLISPETQGLPIKSDGSEKVWQLSTRPEKVSGFIE
jgi:hypothetical protein